MPDSNPRPKPAAPMMPQVLCVDLDDTLVRTDVLLELALAATKGGVQHLFAALRSLAGGKAPFKAELARRVSLDPAALPYNQALLGYLREQRRSGRRIVLATASNRRVAQTIADHLGDFDEVVASDDENNLRGEVKARRLVAIYGERGFGYVGSDASDLPIWSVAGSAVVVGGNPTIFARIPCRIEAHIRDDVAGAKTLVRAIRPHQWVKNLLLFLPLVTSNAISESHAVLLTTAAFVCFGTVASGVYVINDLMDLEADRGHEHKRFRPLASGALPIKRGVLLGPGMVAVGAAVAFALSPEFGCWMLVYVVLSTAYSVHLKTVPLLDAFVLSGLYVLRVVAGGAVSGHHASVWLLNFSGFLFLSLAFLKRFIEISRTSGERVLLDRRGYFNDEAHLVLGLGLASTFSASIVLGLYVNSGMAKAIYTTPGVIWGLVPLVLFWQCRLWLLALRDQVDNDPILFAVKDRGSWVITVLAGLCYALAIAGPL